MHFIKIFIHSLMDALICKTHNSWRHLKHTTKSTKLKLKRLPKSFWYSSKEPPLTFLPVVLSHFTLYLSTPKAIKYAKKAKGFSQFPVKDQQNSRLRKHLKKSAFQHS